MHLPSVSAGFVILFGLLACSGGGGGAPVGGPGGSSGLTVAYVESILQTGLFESMTPSGTILILDDGIQGSSIDIERIIVGKANSTSFTDAFVFAFSVKNYNTSPSTFMAFYIDIDANPNTGQSIDGIGADVLMLDSRAFDGSGSLMNSSYYVWTSQWTETNGNGSADFNTGISFVRAVSVFDNTSGALFGLSAIQGVAKIITLQTGDPNLVSCESDSTSVFTFDMP